MKRITRNGELGLGNHSGAAAGLVSSSLSSSSSLLPLSSTKKTKNNDTENTQQDPSTFPHRLIDYSLLPPSEDISLEDFEQLAWSRLNLLRGIENATNRFSFADPELMKTFRHLEDKWMPLHIGNTANASNATTSSWNFVKERKRDHLSHYILRLAFFSSPEGSRWFQQQECLLFRLRFSSLTIRERISFIPFHISSYQSVVPSTMVYGDDTIRLPWEMVPDLVSKRTVPLHKGTATVPLTEAFSISQTLFREQLALQMQHLKDNHHLLIGDERLQPLLELVRELEQKEARKKEEDEIRKEIHNNSTIPRPLRGEMMEPIIKNHLPPCMKRLYLTGKEKNHLKYQAREQLSLFLKSIGFELEESLKIWRSLFVPRCGEASFNKEYLYNIRHNYGLEGKRVSYEAPPCSRIINGPTPQGGDEVHGCPFRHMEPTSLMDLLKTSTIQSKTEDLEDIIKLGGGGGSHCQQACAKYLDLLNPPPRNSPPSEAMVTPARFFDISASRRK